MSKWAFKLIFVLGLASAGPSRAIQPEKPLSPGLIAIEACRAISDPAARLACFEASTDRLIKAARIGEVTLVDRGQMRQTRRSLFGFSMPKLPFFAGDSSADDETDELESTITSAQSIGYGKYQIRIADGGAAWRTTEPSTAMHDPKKGDKIVIRRAIMGGYILRINGQRGIRGIRVG